MFLLIYINCVFISCIVYLFISINRGLRYAKLPTIDSAIDNIRQKLFQQLIQNKTRAGRIRVMLPE